MHGCQHLCDQAGTCVGVLYLPFGDRLCLGVNTLGDIKGVPVLEVQAKLPITTPITAEDLKKRPPVALKRHVERK
jgi:hypothetical protein